MADKDFFAFCTSLKPSELKAMGELSRVVHFDEGDIVLVDRRVPALLEPDQGFLHGFDRQSLSGRRRDGAGGNEDTRE